MNEHDLEEKAEHIENSDVRENSDIAAASYTLFFAPILLFTRKDSEFVRFHAQQATVLLIAFLVLWNFGGFFQFLTIFVILAAVLGLTQAFKGKFFQIPVVYELTAQGFSLSKATQNAKKIGQNAFFLTKKMMPKSLQGKMENMKMMTPVEVLEKKIFFLEKELMISKFFSHTTVILPEEKQEISAQFLKWDKNTKTQEHKTHIEFSGNFGAILIGKMPDGNLLFALSEKNILSAESQKSIFFFADFFLLKTKNPLEIWKN